MSKCYYVHKFIHGFDGDRTCASAIRGRRLFEPRTYLDIQTSYEAKERAKLHLVLGFTPREDPSVMDFIGGWVGSSAGLMTPRKIKVSTTAISLKNLGSWTFLDIEYVLHSLSQPRT